MSLVHNMTETGYMPRNARQSGRPFTIGASHLYKTQSCGGATFLKLYRETISLGSNPPGGWPPTGTLGCLGTNCNPLGWHPMPVRASSLFSFALRPLDGTRRAAIGCPQLSSAQGKGSRPDLPRNGASWPGVHKGVTYHLRKAINEMNCRERQARARSFVQISAVGDHRDWCPVPAIGLLRCNVTTPVGQPHLGDDCSPGFSATFSLCCLLPTAWCVLGFYSVRPCGMTPLADWLSGLINWSRDGCTRTFKYLVSPHSLALVNHPLLDLQSRRPCVAINSTRAGI